MKRRNLIKGALGAGAAALVLPQSVLPQQILAPKLPARMRRGLKRDAILAHIAKREQARAMPHLWRTDVVGIADYGLRSSEERFHFVDLERGVVNSYLVSHGDGSDPDHDGWLNWFSNEEGSHCSSKGLYATFGWYTGRFGTSIRLEGLDPTNSNALDRAIVMHRAKYAERAHLERWGRLGRSNGCFAMGEADFKLALLQLGGGRALYADSLGLAPDGSRVRRPEQDAGLVRPQERWRNAPQSRPAPQEMNPLMPDPPRGQDLTNPGVY